MEFLCYNEEDFARAKAYVRPFDNIVYKRDEEVNTTGLMYHYERLNWALTTQGVRDEDILDKLGEAVKYILEREMEKEESGE